MIAIGDIHGCTNTLEALLEKLEEYTDHHLIFLGDYIDRGPGSKQVVDQLMELEKRRDCIFLRGNHEQMLLNAVEDRDVQYWLINGGAETLASYGLKPGELKLPSDHLDFYRRTRPRFSTEDYFFVHAGAPAYQTIEKSLADPEVHHDFLWGRDHMEASEVKWEKTVVFGHTPVEKPLVRPKMIGIDTGCIYKDRGMGILTAVLLPEISFIQEACIDG